MLLYLTYIIFLIVGVVVFYLTQRSDDYFRRTIGIASSTYQIPLVLMSYDFYYFGSFLKVNFSIEHYIAAIIFNIGVIATISLKIANIKIIDTLFLKAFARFLLILACIAFLVDIAFNLQHLILDKALRYSSNSQKIPNLILIDIDWIIILQSYGIVLLARGRKLTGAALATLCAAAGLLLGMRYYVVVLAIYAFLEVTRNTNKNIKPVYSSIFVMLIPLAGDALDAIKSYVAFYEWVGDKSFIAYWLNRDQSKFASGEIGAIGANFFIGLTHQLPAVDFLSYFAAAIPFANRFYAFSQQSTFYSSISGFLSDIDLYSGQGTAFSLILETAHNYGLSFIFIAVLKLTYQKVYSTEFKLISDFIMILIIFNLMRNGLVVTISLFKIYLMLFAIYFTYYKFRSSLVDPKKLKGRSRQ
jgi:hypothetical protein